MIELLFLLIPLIPFVVSRFGRHWRGTVMLLMIFMVFEGAFRKWLLPGFQAEIYIVKDVVLAFALAGFFMERRLSGAHEPLMSGLRWFVVLCMVYCFMQLVNPNSPSPLVWAIGFKSYFLYVGLLFMTPYIFSSAADMEKKLKLYMLIMVPVALLGLVQFFSPRDHWINTLVTHDFDVAAHVSAFGEEASARASGTFSNIGGFATFLPAMFVVSFAHLLSSQGAFWRNWIALAMLTSCALAMFTTGSRTVILSTATIAAVMALLCLRAGLISPLAALRAALAGIAIGVFVTLVAGDAVDAFLYRTENADDPIVRLLSPFVELWGSFAASPLLGTGVGTAHNSAAVMMRAPDMPWLHGNHFELETARVMQELGLIGFILVYFPRIALIAVAARMTFRLRTPLFKAMSAAICAYFIPQLFLFVINNPTGGLFFWFYAGLLYGMYRMDYEAAVAQMNVAATAPSPSGHSAAWPHAARGYRG